MLNPYTCPIEGDLSRADVVALTLLCRNKRVIEFGLGGSTIILKQIAKSLITYETKPVWVDRFKEKTPDCDIRIVEETKDGSSWKGLGEECDVVFSDGWAAMRAPFIFEFWPYLKECAITHDSRIVYGPRCVALFAEKYNPPIPKQWGHNPFTATLERIDWSYLESNMIVLHKRNC